MQPVNKAATIARQEARIFSLPPLAMASTQPRERSRQTASRRQRKSLGIRNRAISVSTSMPPMTAVPMTCRAIAPAPEAVHSGTHPRMNAKDVMRAVLAAQTAVQIRKNSQPLPAVLGFFSGYVDLARYGDSRYLYCAGGLKDFGAMIEPLKGLGMVPYVGDHDRKDPVLSPMYADLKEFPPTLCMTSTRDHCLSGTTDFHRALLRAGVDARLMVFDALPHAFWYRFDFPEIEGSTRSTGRLSRHTSADET